MNIFIKVAAGPTGASSVNISNIDWMGTDSSHKIKYAIGSTSYELTTAYADATTATAALSELLRNLNSGIVPAAFQP